ncbi:MAG: hypothetical protein OHK0039_14380 [Bacteroidia bacterium]
MQRLLCWLLAAMPCLLLPAQPALRAPMLKWDILAAADPLLPTFQPGFEVALHPEVSVLVSAGIPLPYQPLVGANRDYGWYTRLRGELRYFFLPFESPATGIYFALAGTWGQASYTASEGFYFPFISPAVRSGSQTFFSQARVTKRIRTGGLLMGWQDRWGRLVGDISFGFGLRSVSAYYSDVTVTGTSSFDIVPQFGDIFEGDRYEPQFYWSMGLGCLLGRIE